MRVGLGTVAGYANGGAGDRGGTGIDFEGEREGRRDEHWSRFGRIWRGFSQGLAEYAKHAVVG